MRPVLHGERPALGCRACPRPRHWAANLVPRVPRVQRVLRPGARLRLGWVPPSTSQPPLPRACRGGVQGALRPLLLVGAGEREAFENPLGGMPMPAYELFQVGCACSWGEGWAHLGAERCGMRGVQGRGPWGLA